MNRVKAAADSACEGMPGAVPCPLRHGVELDFRPLFFLFRVDMIRHPAIQKSSPVDENMTDGLALQGMVTDEQGWPVDFRVLEVYPSFERLVGSVEAEIVAHRQHEITPEPFCWSITGKWR